MVLKLIADKEQDELTSAREVCDKFNTPFDTTARVMQLMGNVGILNSTQGVKGGYSLKAQLKNVSYLQLSELIEGRKVSHDCSSAKCALIDSCNITGPIKKLNQYLMLFFQELSLEELLLDKNLGPVETMSRVMHK